MSLEVVALTGSARNPPRANQAPEPRLRLAGRWMQMRWIATIAGGRTGRRSGRCRLLALAGGLSGQTTR